MEGPDVANASGFAPDNSATRHSVDRRIILVDDVPVSYPVLMVIPVPSAPTHVLWATAAEVQIALGRIDKGNRLIREALTAPGKSEDRFHVVVWRRVAGLALTTPERWDEAQRALQMARQLAHGMSWPYAEALTWFELGRLKAHIGESGSASTSPTGAAAVFPRAAKGELSGRSLPNSHLMPRCYSPSDRYGNAARAGEDYGRDDAGQDDTRAHYLLHHSGVGGR